MRGSAICALFAKHTELINCTCRCEYGEQLSVFVS